MVFPTWDRTLGTLVTCLDATLRRLGGVPTYALTDNEKTVTVDHVATLAVRHPEIVAASRHYGLTVHTCLPADPESKGGSEATVRVAKRDLVPTEVSLRESYASFAELARACEAFCHEVNGRVHRETDRVPAGALAEEQARLHRLPDEPYATAFGQTRRVMWDSTISIFGVRYSVPTELIDERVWARTDGEEIVITHIGARGPVEVARYQQASKGNPQIRDEHYPTRCGDPTDRRPRARSAAEAEFLAIGEGASQWLSEAAAAGVSRIRAKMAEAVRSQRWDPAETLRVLLAEEATGRATSATHNRRRRAGFPAGKTFDSWDETASSIVTPTQQASVVTHRLSITAPEQLDDHITEWVSEAYETVGPGTRKH